MKTPIFSRAAFTLVELSIVLVILGLLVGGVLSGQSLIHAAELRSITTQYDGYVTATQSFRDKYFALPGDMTNATSFWGAADGSTGNTAACATAASTGTETCNGNGDGQIYWGANTYEWFRFWQHLANAGLIEGHFTGTGPVSGNLTAAQVPLGKIGSSIWWAGGYTFAASFYTFDGPEGPGVYVQNSFVYAKTGTAWTPHDPILKPEDAWNIDTKMDDGKPATGNVVITSSAGLNACTDTSTSSNFAANYLLTATGTTCALVFRGGPF